MTREDGRKGRLLRAFDGAASSYDDHAPVQRAVAARLADRIAALPLQARPRIMEIGCGTGFLSEALRLRLGPADWVITDLSPAMLAACRARLGDPADTGFEVLDAEQPPPDGEPYDLICASLSFQWLHDLPAVVDRLTRRLRPGGYLAFATLAEGTLGDWRQAHADLGLQAGTPAFPSLDQLASLGDGRTRIETEQLVQVHADGRAFLKSLKGIGAGTPSDGRRPLGTGDLSRVMARFEALGAAAAYHVAYGIWRQSSPRGVFVTGTDTGIGKTAVAAWLARAWDADYWKPVQTGLAEDEGDTAAVARLAGLTFGRLHAPRHAFAAPVSPHLAAAAEGSVIALEDFDLPASPRPIVVEGAGGALVPLNDRQTMIDLMARLALPVVVVAPNRLGAISQTLMTLETIRRRGLEILGVVLVGPPFADNRAAIETHGGVPVLAELPWAEPLDEAAVRAWTDLAPPLERPAT